MKAVLIAESEDTIKEYSAFLEEAGADVITYRWFLKALDNLSEIQPHIILVSALDFPRHWKTLFTHIEAGEIKTQPVVYLITEPSFTPSEKKKAMFLGAQDILQSPLSNRDKNSLLSMLPAGMGIETKQTPAGQPVSEETAGQKPATEDFYDGDEDSFVENTPYNMSEDDSDVGEYAELKKQALAENKIHDIAEAEANGFDIVDSELSDFNPHDEAVMQEVRESGIIEQDNSLVVEGADEDILTKLEDEMTVREVPEELKDEPEEAPEAEVESETSVEEAVVNSEPSVEPVETAEPESEDIAEERPEQISWSASVNDAEDEAAEAADDPIQFSFVNPSTGLVVTGTVQSYAHPTLTFVPSSSESVNGIRFGQIFEQCKFTFEGETVKARAQVRGLGQAIEFCLLY